MAIPPSPSKPREIPMPHTIQFSAGPKSSHIDALSIGLFGLTVGAITLGFHQLRVFGREDQFDVLAVWIMALLFGGIVQIIAGFVEVRYDQQLGGTALTMYGFLWLGTSILGILQTMSNKGPHPYVEIPLLAVFACFSAVMVYLTGHKTFVLCLLHIVITATLTAVVLAKLGLLGETLPGIGHLLIGGLAFVHAMGTLVNEFTTQTMIPLGRAPLHLKHVNGRAVPTVDIPRANLSHIEEAVLNLP
jgi:succinate-acetate transporter protein